MKKIVSLLLVLVMMLGLVACGGPAAVEGNGTGNADYDEATFDFYTSELGSSKWDGSLPLVPEGEEYTITMGIKPSSLVLDYETNEFIVWLEEKTGVNIEIKEFAGSSSDVQTQISLMLNGGEKVPDIMIGLISKTMACEFGREGYLMNIAGYLQNEAHYMEQQLKLFYPEQEKYDMMMQNMWKTIGDPVSNKAFCFPVLYYSHCDNMAHQIMINREWLDKLGLEKPKTPDELYNVLVAFRDQDPNGNGKKDEIPLIGRDASRGDDAVSWIINSFIQYHIGYNFVVENGKLVLPHIEDEYREALKFLNKLYKEGLINDTMWSMSTADFRNILNPAEGKPFTVGIACCPIDARYNEGHNSIYVYEAMNQLSDAGYGRGGYGMLYIDTFISQMYFSNNIERPEIAYRLVDFMCSGESYLNQRWGMRGKSWDWLPADVDGTGKGMVGGDAKIKLMKYDTFHQTNNETWHTQQSQCAESYYQYYLDPEVNPFGAAVYEDWNMCYDYYMQAGQPEEMFALFYRTPEEDEIYQEYSAEISSYLSRARADFIVGRRDVSDDAEWQKYLDDLDKLNLQECWIDIAEASWARQQAAKKK